MVLSQDTFHLLLTLQLVLKNAQMSLAKGFFRTFPQIKKVQSWLGTRVQGCPPVAAHPLRLLSWRSRPCRTPSSGCGSGNATLARLTSGTDVLTVRSGRHHLVSRSCGSAKGMRREGSGTGTGTRVSPRLLDEELYRQPRAVNKYWAGGFRSCDHVATSSKQFFEFDIPLIPFIDKVLDIPVMPQRQVSAVQLCRLLGPFIPASWPMKLRPRSSSTSAVAFSQLVLLVIMQFLLCSL